MEEAQAQIGTTYNSVAVSNKRSVMKQFAIFFKGLQVLVMGFDVLKTDI